METATERGEMARPAAAQGVLPANKRQYDLLLGLARKIEAQVDRDARSLLWKVKPLRRLGQTARALAEAHQGHNMPDLLTRIQYRPQVEAIVALETWLGQPQPQNEGAERLPLDTKVARALASARIQPAQWEEAVQALQALLPAPDAQSELLFDLSLSRLAKHGYFNGLDAPRDALVKLLDLADLREGLSVLVSSFDAWLLAQTLAEEYPTLRATYAGQDAPGVLTRLFPTLQHSAEPDLLQQSQPFQRVVLRLGGMHWESQRKRADIPLVYAVYRRLPPGGRVVALLDSSYTHPERRPTELAEWARWNGGLGHLERLNPPSYRWPLDLIMMEKRQQAAGS
ncbi:MAG TPA: hypothetical protein VKT82_15580 [Ktedonobacterales bacterium]|nr:hypothetical protein [Ktedonobacterales bacterium]